MAYRTILLQSAAPAKPVLGTACNGCGVCCATEPCPLGRWLSGSSTGACKALEWDGGRSRYHCGAVASPHRYWRWLPAAWGRRLALRWIASGTGCDANVVVSKAARRSAR